jgi:hypothetical protein
VHLPLPAVSAALQVSLVLARTVTVPLGVPVNCGETLKLTVTIWPMIARLGTLDVITVVELALPTSTTPVG